MYNDGSEGWSIGEVAGKGPIEKHVLEKPKTWDLFNAVSK